MSVLNPTAKNDSVVFDREECRRVGNQYNKQYSSATPYPHIVLNDFLPLELLRRVNVEFPTRQKGRFNDATSRLKTGYQMEMISSGYITNLLSALNSSQFLEFLQPLTGIDNLIVDPHYAGGGLHETARGGHLSVHADFNVHPKMPLRRRLNLILFLNENWKDEYGGCLELWERDMSKCAEKVPPAIGTAVIFNTDEDCYHGHPDPLQCPEDTYRRSIAVYYFTASDNLNIERKTTQFRNRPGSADVGKGRYGLRDFVKDLCPPIILKAIKPKKP